MNHRKAPRRPSSRKAGPTRALDEPGGCAFAARVRAAASSRRRAASPTDGTATGTAPNYTCNADGAAGGSYNAGTTTVSGTLNNLAAGSNETVRFRATIN
jgi:hypothetical protein